MRNSDSRNSFWAPILLVSAYSTGCAILTIDVDVYKGALVNEDHVQFHQLVALGSGTKPFLIQLRDRLEWDWPEFNPPPNFKYPQWYQADYVPQPRIVNKENFFSDPRARRVNAILSLYCDVNSPSEKVAEKVAQLSRILEQYENAKLKFEQNPQRDTAIYSEITLGLKDDKLLSPPLTNLKAGYKELLLQRKQGSPIRKVGYIVDVLKLASKQAGVNATPFEKSLLEHWAGTAIYNSKQNENIYQSRVAYRAAWKLFRTWDDKSLLAALTFQLCTSDDPGQKSCHLLVNRTKEIAEAYWTLRDSTQELWQRTLEILLEIELVTPNECRKSKESLIDLTMNLSDVRRIASALDRLPGVTIGKRQSIFPEEASEPVEQWVIADEGRAKDSLRKALVTSTFKTAKDLLTLDLLEKKTLPGGTDTFSQELKRLVEATNAVHTRFQVRLGLTHGYVETEPTVTFQELIASAKNTQHNLAYGLEFGRPQEGLYTLTKGFFACVNEIRDTNLREGVSPVVHDAAEKERCQKQEHELLDGLIEFAQKILFLANHDTLISPDPSPGLIRGGINQINRGLFGNFFTSETNKQYIRVLQAVGNTILFSANELREREKYRTTALAKTEAELRAVNLSHSADPKKVLDTLLDELQAEKSANDTKLIDARSRQLELQNTINAMAADLSKSQTAKANRAFELSTAQDKLSKSQTENEPIKSLYDLLIDGLGKAIRAQWESGKQNASTVADFLTGSEGLAERLQNEHTSLGTALTAEDTKKFTQATAYISDPGSGTAFEARLRQHSVALPTLFVTLLDVFVEHIKELELKRKKDEATLSQLNQQANTALKDIDIAIARLQSQRDSKDKELTELSKQIADLPSDITRLENTRQAILGLKANARKYAESHGQFRSSSAVYGVLDTLLSQEEEKVLGIAKQPYQDARKILSQRTPPLIVLPSSGVYESPQNVMDDIIAMLRHRQIEAVERFGSGSDQDTKATKALEAAYQHRSRMLYIRPSSAYLRTSYPSTSLQNDPNLTYDNMLLQQGMSALPFSSQVRDVLDPVVTQDRLLTAELDKQFWQNINRVRVAGTGFTNQAAVKDDVGNWYVKQYYGDTDKIFQSAAHLGLYSLGAKLPIDLAGQLNTATKPADAAKVSGSTSPPLNTVLEKHRTAYQTKTDDQLKALEDSHDKNIIRDEISKRFADIPELKDDDASQQALNSALTHAIRKWDQDIAVAKDKQAKDRGILLTSEIRALYWFGKSLVNEIQLIDKDPGSSVNGKLSGLIRAQKNATHAREEAEKSLPLDTQDLRAKRKVEDGAADAVQNERNRLLAVKTKTARIVNKTVGPLVVGILKERKDTIENYEQALAFIGEAAKP